VCEVPLTAVGIYSKKIATMTDTNSMLMVPYRTKIKAFIETMGFINFGECNR